MLKRIHIENFKSLKNVTLDLQPVNLLIGPNNSGKSNLLKALEFMSSCITRKFIGENSVKNLTYLHEYINRTIIVKVTNLYEEDTENIFNNYQLLVGLNEGFMSELPTDIS